MRMSCTAALAACLACACGTLPGGAPDGDVREVAFSCADGSAVTVRFHTADERAVLVRNGDEIELQQQPSASGFIYSNGPNTIRGKGDELILEIGRMMPIQCQAA